MFQLFASGLGIILSWPAVALAQTDDSAAAALGLGILGGFFLIWVIIFILVVLSFVLWLWALIDAIKREFPNPNDKTLWIVILTVGFLFGFGFGLIAAIIYLIVGRAKGTIPGQPAAHTQPQK